MAYKRSLTTRVSLLRQRFHPSFSYIGHDDDGKHEPPAADTSRRVANTLLRRGYHSSNVNSATAGFGALFQDRYSSFSPPLALGSSFHRYSSSSIGDGSENIEYMSNASEGAEKIDYFNDVAEVLSKNSMEIAASQAPVVSEVAIAAADSYLPVAALQYLIDGVHSLPGVPWWLAIAMTTMLIRGVTVPLLINQLKATTKLTLMRPRLEEIKQRMQDTGMDPKSVAEGQKQMQELFKEYGVTPFTPLKGLFIQGPIFISFFLAITNMVEKVPSFKVGGAFWFTDLTTPDSLYIFPVLTALSFLITVECNMQEGLEGNPIAKTMKNFSRVLAVLTVPFTMSFPNAIFCYWVPSNLFSLMYGLAIKRPEVKKYLNIPIIPMPPTTAPQPAFSTFPASGPSEPTSNELSSVPVTPSDVSEQKISSSSVLSQKIRTLEEQVKAKNSKETSEGEKLEQEEVRKKIVDEI